MTDPACTAAWAAIITTWTVIVAWFIADLGFDPARIPVAGPFMERIWNVLVGCMRTLLGEKR